MNLNLLLYAAVVCVILGVFWDPKRTCNWLAKWKDIFRTCKEKNIGIIEFIQILILAAAETVKDKWVDTKALKKELIGDIIAAVSAIVFLVIVTIFLCLFGE